MDNNLFEKLSQRYMAGEKVTSLAKDAGIPWQRLWGMLNSLPRKTQTSQPKETRQERQPRRRGRIRNRFHRTEGQDTAANPVRRDADGIDRITFDSVGEAVIDALADYAQNEGNLKMIRENLAGHLTGSDPWANYFTKEKLLSVIANPPAELLEAVDAMRQELVDEVQPPTCPRRRVRHGQEFGEELDSDRYLSRDMNPWDRSVRETQPRRTVTIGVNLTVSCGQRSNDLLWRGAAAVALADILTQRGINCEIVAFWTMKELSTSSRMVVAKYMVKRADMPLDLGSVALVLAEIAFARLIGLYGLARHVMGGLSEHLGFVAPLPDVDRAGIDYLSDQDITYRGAAESWLRNASARQGTEAACA